MGWSPCVMKRKSGLRLGTQPFEPASSGADMRHGFEARLDRISIVDRLCDSAMLGIARAFEVQRIFTVEDAVMATPLAHRAEQGGDRSVLRAGDQEVMEGIVESSAVVFPGGAGELVGKGRESFTLRRVEPCRCLRRGMPLQELTDLEEPQIFLERDERDGCGQPRHHSLRREV